MTGVASAKADLDKKTVAVVVKKDAKPSPKALWEAIEKAGFKAKKIETPDSTFEEKPKE